MMFKKLAQKLNEERKNRSFSAINPIEADMDSRKKMFLNKLTHSAVEMYERRADIKKFTKLALSDPENTSHNKLVDALFSHGIVSVNEDDEKLAQLSDNKKFLRDLGLI